MAKSYEPVRLLRSATAIEENIVVMTTGESKTVVGRVMVEDISENLTRREVVRKMTIWSDLKKLSKNWLLVYGENGWQVRQPRLKAEKDLLTRLPGYNKLNTIALVMGNKVGESLY